MKKQYSNPLVTVLYTDQNDVIATSGVLWNSEGYGDEVNW